jgi:hypothetical protein
MEKAEGVCLVCPLAPSLPCAVCRLYFFLALQLLVRISMQASSSGWKSSPQECFEDPVDEK